MLLETLTLMKNQNKSVEHLERRMNAEAKSFANYTGGNPMRQIIGKRYEGARKRYLDAIAKSTP